MDKPETEIFYCERKCSEASGEGRMTFIADKLGFTVFKGSVVSSYICDSLPLWHQGYYNWRIRLEDEGVIKNRVFQTDYTFSSPSLAATVVLGASANGNTEWHTASGKLLGDVRPDY